MLCCLEGLTQGQGRYTSQYSVWHASTEGLSWFLASVLKMGAVAGASNLTLG